jgi:dipeptidyl aminopeptidase/acylaminoacyl peptidase
VPRRTDPERVIRSQVVLEEHDVAADGRFAVVVRRFVECDRYRSHLWLVPLDGKDRRPVQLTDGRVRDATPRIAPDGSAIAFRRTPAAECPPRGRDKRASKEEVEDETARLFVLPLRAGNRPGRPWSIRTPPDRSVGELAWAPDGRRLALTFDAGPLRFIVGPEPKAGAAPLARRIARIDWRYDETPHVDRWSHLHVVEARRGARPRQVTAGDWGAAEIAWSPDGRTIAFAADPRPDADVAPRRSICTVDADAREAGLAGIREVFGLGGDAYWPAWSPDGRWISAVGYVEASARDDTSPELVIGPADGSSAPRRVAPALDRPIGNWIDTDLHGWSAGYRVVPCWLDRSTIVAIVSDRGRATPWRFDIDPVAGVPVGDPSPLTSTDVAACSLAVASGPDVPPDARVTLLACLGDRPMELVTIPADAPRATSPAVARTRLGSRWADGLDWPAMRLVEAPGPGGPMEMWIASPKGASDTPLPTVVNIHGGPLGAWAPAPSLEVVLLCARGYRVLLPNIRGSTSYGRGWIRPQLGDWGGVDAVDVHAAIDHAVALGLADPDRLGVMGLSYGGFLVDWLVATSHRFRAGISEGGVVNQVSIWANSDTGVEFNRMALLGVPLDAAGVAGLWRQSPFAHVADIRTPLLLLQGEADLRCPPNDAEQLFVALRVLGRTVEYVLYPEEFHVFATAGRPDRRIDRMNRVLDWFDRHVRG